MLKHVEHGVPTCAVQYLAPVQQANIVAFLEGDFGFDSTRFFVIFVQYVCVICLTVVEDKINLNGNLNLNLN